MPPQSVITSSLGEVKQRLSALERRCSQLEGRVHLIELPGDTVAQEVERLRENAERTLVEMRQMRESIFAWGRTTKKNCKVYADAMQTYFQFAEKSIISHKEENKRQREILKRFVFDTEKQMVKARDIRDIIDPLKKDVEALKQIKDRAPLALQDEVNVDTLIAPLTDWTLTEVEERSLGDILEFPRSITLQVCKRNLTIYSTDCLLLNKQCLLDPMPLLRQIRLVSLKVVWQCRSKKLRMRDPEAHRVRINVGELVTHIEV